MMSSRNGMDSQKLFLQSFFLILHFTVCSSKDTITVNQTIQDGNLLISKGKNFALGFFSPGRSRYRYLGIWYYKVREQTVVWVANRNDPINGSSGVLSINQYGNLILYSNLKQKILVWSTNVSVEMTGTCVAQLLDSGNLVLIQERSKRVVWQSFDYPTDTHLPGMKLGMNRKTGFHNFLTSWRSADDPGIGDYSIGLNPNGSPQAILYRGTEPYWRSSPWPIKMYVDVRNFTFVNNQDEVYSTFDLVDDSVILRIKLDYSGLVMHLTWHESDGKWKEFYSAPNYRCESYGYCGAFGKCDPVHVQRFECDCLPGYEPKFLRDWNILMDASSGCVRKRQESSPMCKHGEGFVEVASVKIPDTSAAVWLGLNMSPMNCELECRRNCSCSAYASIAIPEKGTGCLAWYGELMDTMVDMEAGYNIYVRVDALELARNKWNERLLHTITDAYPNDTLVANEGRMSHPDITIFNLSTILAATNNFSPTKRLGQGGFGLVYKGQLSNGQEVAVKRLSKNSEQGIEEFKNEVMLIAKLQHKNLVKLIGCCIQGEEPMLVYEYLPNKSLDSFLFDETKRAILDWRKRFDIIVGIARGILYIHQDSRLSIIHRDLKTSNILLDAEMNPKISDFGLARIFKGDQIQEKTNKIVGTFGYMSPEYVMFGKFSTKSDVFSFGVILLEIITGKKNSSYFQEDSYMSMTGHIWHSWRENTPLEIVDSSLRESCPPHEVLRCIQIGLLCVQEDILDRPTMSAVVLMLNSETTLPPPGQPAFILRKSYNSSSSFAKRDGFYSVDEETITEVVCR
ncbi:G-type lectin S-receptor-like serine/threonine-protein kinase RKS1 isoform X2 [Hevea brasiliensis]|uniref:G-type lectin S-receptor-like serine/threonine-protein kinase RKS1 isoform X2 n=1 Tax=Hevea brasiliensis TaxID=3981 RepID=UPI0025EB32B6|nr:G-type lectin S-receptor-like serine/threonine-protein kinase RKS1 isoform X2 [Hevea brasiliensis]